MNNESTRGAPPILSGTAEHLAKSTCSSPSHYPFFSPVSPSLQMTATAQQPSKAQPVHLSAAPAPTAAVPPAAGDPQAQLEADKRAVYR